MESFRLSPLWLRGEAQQSTLLDATCRGHRPQQKAAMDMDNSIIMSCGHSRHLGFVFPSIFSYSCPD